ncbi:Transmembrane protein 33, partial [Eschrichtius robustus]|nr:Transmembrane protein 33 [Eschrichtius robustus]
MWLSRLFTVYCSALFVLPLLGLHEAASFYQRALLANALTSALRLHQRLPHFQLSRAFLAQALLEDSCHYLLYSLIFVNSYPVTSILLYLFDSEIAY